MGCWAPRREEQSRCLRKIARHQEADRSYLDEGVQILELARNAQRLFALQEPREKRRLLDFVLSNCSWEDGEVAATFRQPFDLLAETNALVDHRQPIGTANPAKTEIWLPRYLRTRARHVQPRRAHRPAQLRLPSP
jgi:hypothetical protein